MQASTYSKFQMRDHKLLEIGLMISLAIHVGLFTGYKRFVQVARIAPVKIGDIRAIEIPQTVQKKKVIPPAKPFVPIPSEDPMLPDPVPSEVWTNLDDGLGEAPPPPDPPMSDYEFVVYDEEPQPIGGYSAILNNIVYPKMAISLGIEGQTTIQAIIDEYGKVLSTEVIKSVGYEPCDRAAEDAIKATKWKPAMQRDKPVKVKIAIPINFKIKS